MQTLNLASAPATENQAASILVMDDTGNVFCTIFADGKIKVIGEDAELIAPEMVQINLVQQNFDLFFKNIHSAAFIGIKVRVNTGVPDVSNFGDPVQWQKEVRKDRNIGREPEKLEQLLTDLWEYMDSKADCNTDGTAPNKEMVFRSRIERIEALNIILK